MLNDKILIDDCINNAKELFKELNGEFYPFGYILSESLETRSVNIYSGNEYPKSIEVITELAKNLMGRLKLNEFEAFAICYLASKEMESHTYDLLYIMIADNSGITKNTVAVIDINHENYTFEVVDQFETIGTIDYYVSGNASKA